MKLSAKEKSSKTGRNARFEGEPDESVALDETTNWLRLKHERFR